MQPPEEDPPKGKFDQLIHLVMHPTPSLQALEAEMDAGGGPPVPLWRLIAILSLIGFFIYGFSIGLLIEGWRPVVTALIFALVIGVGWALYLLALLALPSPAPRWFRTHVALMGMIYGEFVFECGIVLNLAFWWSKWLTASQALSLVHCWVGLASFTTFFTMISQWEQRGWRSIMPATLWLALFNGWLLVASLWVANKFS